MKKTIIAIIMLISTIGFAADKISPEILLKRIDTGRLTMDINPVGRNLILAHLMKMGQTNDSEGISKTLGSTKLLAMEAEQNKMFASLYYFFDPEMMNVRYYQEDNYRYYITFDFATTRKCTLRIEKIDPKCGNSICDESITDPRKSANVDINGKIIADSYCEKLYGIKIKQQIQQPTSIK